MPSFLDSCCAGHPCRSPRGREEGALGRRSLYSLISHAIAALTRRITCTARMHSGARCRAVLSCAIVTEVQLKVRVDIAPKGRRGVVLMIVLRHPARVAMAGVAPANIGDSLAGPSVGVARGIGRRLDVRFVGRDGGRRPSGIGYKEPSSTSSCPACGDCGGSAVVAITPDHRLGSAASG
jgi:hypothetical protein